MDQRTASARLASEAFLRALDAMSAAERLEFFRDLGPEVVAAWREIATGHPGEARRRELLDLMSARLFELRRQRCSIPLA